MIITPTVGRVVWYYPGEAKDVQDKKQPMAALVAYVHTDRMVNLAVFDHCGGHAGTTSVPLVQEGDDFPSGGESFCCWMPYQQAQAKKHAESKE